MARRAASARRPLRPARTFRLMVANAAPAPREAAGARPYRPSWFDWAFDLLERAPGPTWLAYFVLVIPSVLLNQSALWLSALIPLGQVDGTQLFWGVMTVLILASMHYLRHVAERAFDAFSPALGEDAVELSHERYRMAIMPARPVLALTAFAFVITPIYYVTDPVVSQVVGLTPIGLVPRAISECLTSAIVLCILLQAFRQMRGVARLHARATRIDLFRPAPVYAFSRLTATAGVILILFNTLGLAANPSVMTATTATLILYVPWLVAFLVGAVVIFLVPLLGMHDRLVAEKGRLAGEAEERLQAILGALNEDIDGLELSRADGLGKLLDSQLRQREILGKLSTWPWSGATIRGFGSALALPMVLFLVQRWLGLLLGG